MKNSLILCAMLFAFVAVHGCDDCCTAETLSQQNNMAACCSCTDCCCNGNGFCNPGSCKCPCCKWTKTFPTEPGVYPVRQVGLKEQAYALVYYDSSFGNVRSVPVLRAKFNDVDTSINHSLTKEQEGKCQIIWGNRIPEPESWGYLAEQITKREKFLRGTRSTTKAIVPQPVRVQTQRRTCGPGGCW